MKLNLNTQWDYAPAPESMDHIKIQKRYGHFINGEFREPVNGKYFDTINPANLEKLAEVAEGSKEDIDLAVQSAKKAYNFYSELPGLFKKRQGNWRLLNL
jgi:aldehyde dehydrogenase (NAD+)